MPAVSLLPTLSPAAAPGEEREAEWLEAKGTYELACLRRNREKNGKRGKIMTRLLVIGGSDAGVSAALRAREVDASANVAVMAAGDFANYSICGLPFYLSGEVPDWRALAHRTEEEITNTGIHLFLNHSAQSIDPLNHKVTAMSQQGALQLSYDRLVIATGAAPVRPALSGLDLPGVFLLRSLHDSFAIERWLSGTTAGNAMIIGGGYIGLEMADALTRRGYVVEYSPSVLKTVDSSLGQLVSAELRRHNVAVVIGVSVEQISRDGTRLQVSGVQGFARHAALILVAVGVQPSTDLARKAGIKTDRRVEPSA